MVGFGEPDPSDPDVVDWSKLEDRDGVAYLSNEETPYTGHSKGFHKNGQKAGEGNFKDGKKNGLWTTWHENGQKRDEITWKEDKPNGLATQWYENGQKKKEGNNKDGKPDGLYTLWYENGQKSGEGTYKESKLVTVVQWKFNGEKCPVTNIDEDGNGVWVLYNDGGTERFRYSYKNGERVRN